MARAQWLGYVVGRDGKKPVGHATAGARRDEVMREIDAFVEHREGPDGAWTAMLHPCGDRPPQIMTTEKPVTTLHSSLTVASFLADRVMAPGAVVVHAIDGDPSLLVAEYRRRHPNGLPVVNRMWTEMLG